MDFRVEILAAEWEFDRSAIHRPPLRTGYLQNENIVGVVVVFRSLCPAWRQIGVGLQWKAEFLFEATANRGERGDYRIEEGQNNSRAFVEKLVDRSHIQGAVSRCVIRSPYVPVDVFKRDVGIIQIERGDGVIHVIQRQEKRKIVRLTSSDDEWLFFPMLVKEGFFAYGIDQPLERRSK